MSVRVVSVLKKKAKAKKGRKRGT
jgi:hypothetical protein